MAEDDRGPDMSPHDRNDDDNEFWSSAPSSAGDDDVQQTWSQPAERDVPDPEEPPGDIEPEWAPPKWATDVTKDPLPSSGEDDFGRKEAESDEGADDAAPPMQGPGAFTPRVLSKRRAATLAAVAQALLPRGGRVHESAADVGVAERLDAVLASWEPEARRGFMRFVTVFEWSSVFSRHLRRFSRLSPGAQQAYVRRADASRLLLRRGASDTLRFYCVNQWAATPVVESKIGFTYGCESADPPRDAPPLEVIEFPQVSADHTEECDVVVIGSGAGGAVVAKELAESGLSVIVLEEGPHHTRNDYGGAPFDRFQRLYRQNGLTATLGRPVIPLPLGMGIGGTTAINSGTCFRTPDRVLARWEREFSLPAIDGASLRTIFDRVERIQHVVPVPEEILGQNARVFRRGVERLGLHGTPIRRNIEGCRGCGVCAFGCPSDAKLSTRLTYLPMAQHAGAGIYANTRAERILIEGGRARGVVAHMLDPLTREPRATLTVKARVVVVAAGAIHTPALLAANALGNRSGHLGRHLRIHPACSVGGFFEEKVYAWRGTMQSFFVDDWHESQEILIEVTSSVPSIGAGTFRGGGLEMKEMIGAFPHVASAGLFVSDTSEGRVFRRSGGEPIITYRFNKQDAQRMVRGLVKTAEVMFAAGAAVVNTGLPGIGYVRSAAELADIREEAVKPRALRLSAFHPVGTARMAANPADGVVGSHGEVHGVGGLFVADASVLPGCPTVNPQITIMALATRTADHIAGRSAEYFA